MPKLLTLLIILLLCSCGSNDTAHSDSATNPSTNSPPAVIPKQVSYSIVYDTTPPGNIAPDTTYLKSIAISGSTITAKCSGGSKDNCSSWSAELNHDEINKLNGLLSQTINPEIRDLVSEGFLYDGPCLKLVIGDIKQFDNGMFFDPVTNKSQTHQFPVEANNLINFLVNINNTHQIARQNQRI